MRGPKSGKSRPSETDVPPADERLLKGLAPDEANAVLRDLLAKHPELRSEAEDLAREVVTPTSIEEIADEVFDAVSNVDLEALNERAGSHSWGYVAPSEAAEELLEESLEHLIDDMKRQIELGLAAGAEAICAGIVEGLYRAREVNSDGALGWAPDFPIEQAGHVLTEFLKSLAPVEKLAARKSLLKALATRAPAWTDMLRRAADHSIDG